MGNRAVRSQSREASYYFVAIEGETMKLEDIFGIGNEGENLKDLLDTLPEAPKETAKRGGLVALAIEAEITLMLIINGERLDSDQKVKDILEKLSEDTGMPTGQINVLLAQHVAMGLIHKAQEYLALAQSETIPRDMRRG